MGEEKRQGLEIKKLFERRGLVYKILGTNNKILTKAMIDLMIECQILSLKQIYDIYYAHC